jgi:HlyD family secretion protein
MASMAPNDELNNDLNRLRIDRGRKKTPRLRWLRKLIITLAIVGGVVALLHYRQTHATIEVHTTRAELESLSSDGLAPVLTASGYVIPRRRINVSSMIIGRVVDVLVERGSKVKAGDVLVRIEDNEYHAQVHQAEAALGSAQARLKELRTGSRPQEKTSARAQVDSATAQLDNARRERDRLKALRLEGVISQQEFDRVQMQYDVAEAALVSARKQAELVNIGPRSEQITAAEAQVREAEANVEYAKTQLGFTVITAPIDGTILEKVAEKGELLTNTDFGGTQGAKSAAVSMANLSDLQVEIDLNESQVGKTRLGQACEIELDSVPGKKFKGNVDEIAPQADRQKGTVQVKVRIIQPNEAVRPEMNALVTFLEKVPAGEGSAPRVWISKAAVKKVGDSNQVYIVEGEQVKAQPITLGEEGPRGIRVLSGLKGGEMLVNAPPETLRTMSKVKVTT